MNIWETWMICARCGVRMLPPNCTKHARKCEAKERRRLVDLYANARNKADQETNRYLAGGMSPGDKAAFANDYGDDNGF